MLQIPEIWEFGQSGNLGRERGEQLRGFGQTSALGVLPLHLLFRKQLPNQTQCWCFAQRDLSLQTRPEGAPEPAALTLCVPGCPQAAPLSRPRPCAPPALYNAQTVSLGAQFPRQSQPKQLLGAFVSRMPPGGRQEVSGTQWAPPQVPRARAGAHAERGLGGPSPGQVSQGSR